MRGVVNGWGGGHDIGGGVEGRGMHEKIPANLSRFIQEIRSPTNTFIYRGILS